MIPRVDGTSIDLARLLGHCTTDLVFSRQLLKLGCYLNSKTQIPLSSPGSWSRSVRVSSGSIRSMNISLMIVSCRANDQPRCGRLQAVYFKDL